MGGSSSSFGSRKSQGYDSNLVGVATDNTNEGGGSGEELKEGKEQDGNGDTNNQRKENQQPLYEIKLCSGGVYQGVATLNIRVSIGV